MWRTGQRTAVLQASRSTQSPIAWIRPASSAIGMKTPAKACRASGVSSAAAPRRRQISPVVARRAADRRAGAGRRAPAPRAAPPRSRGGAGRWSPSLRGRCGSGCALRAWRGRARYRPCGPARRGRRRLPARSRRRSRRRRTRSCRAARTAARPPAMMRSQSASTSRPHVTSVWMMANSSPPSRETSSASRTRPVSRRRKLADQIVAGRMAERIVDVLEAVEIEIEERELRAVVRGHRPGRGRGGR